MATMIIFVAASGNDKEMACIVCVHCLFGGVGHTKVNFMVFDAGLRCERWEIWLGFGGLYSLLNLFHVSFLHFIRFRKVFCHIGHCESRESGEIAIVVCCKQDGFGRTPKGGVEVSDGICHQG